MFRHDFDVSGADMDGAAGVQVTTAQPLFYAAFTPGSECIDEEEGLLLTAGLSDEKVYGVGARNLYFTDCEYDEEGNVTRNDTLFLDDPLVFASMRTFNYTGGAVLRQSSVYTEKIDDKTYVEYMKVRRVVDSSKTGIKNNSGTADLFGWVALSKGGVSNDAVGIDEVVSQGEGAGMSVSVVDRRIIVHGADDFEVYTLGGTKLSSAAVQQPGIYMVRSANSVVKVVVR